MNDDSHLRLIEQAMYEQDAESLGNRKRNYSYVGQQQQQQQQRSGPPPIFHQHEDPRRQQQQFHDHHHHQQHRRPSQGAPLDPPHHHLSPPMHAIHHHPYPPLPPPQELPPATAFQQHLEQHPGDGFVHPGAEHAKDYQRWLHDKAAEFLQMQSSEQLQELQSRLIRRGGGSSDQSSGPNRHQQHQGDSKMSPSRPPRNSPKQRQQQKVKPNIPSDFEPTPLYGDNIATAGARAATLQNMLLDDEISNRGNRNQSVSSNKNGSTANNNNSSSSATNTNENEKEGVQSTKRNKVEFLANTTLARTRREDDAPSTRLARQLIGQDPVSEGCASIALDPDLVQETSNKIRAALNEMVEAAVVKARNDLDQVETDKQKAAQDLEQARALAKERVVTFQERESTRNQLLEKLRVDAELMTALNSELEQLQSGGSGSGSDDGSDELQLSSSSSPDPKSATVTNLWKQLEGGLAKIQSQDRDVAMLRETVRVSALEKERKDALVSELGASLDALQRANNTAEDNNKAPPPPSAVNNNGNRRARTLTSKEAKQQEVVIARLKQQKKELEIMLHQEKHYSELSIQSYMEASIFQLKERRKQDDANDTTG